MAHYPRWVTSFNVDSSAMYAAFAEYMSKVENRIEIEDMGFSGSLTFVDHGRLGTAGSMEHVNVIICNQYGCQRCVTGRGGYMFRWYSPLWSETYVRLAKVGAWMPGQPENLDGPNHMWIVSEPRTWSPSLPPEGFRCDKNGLFIAIPMFTTRLDDCCAALHSLQWSEMSQQDLQHQDAVNLATYMSERL